MNEKMRGINIQERSRAEEKPARAEEKPGGIERTWTQPTHGAVRSCGAE